MEGRIQNLYRMFSRIVTIIVALLCVSIWDAGAFDPDNPSREVIPTWEFGSQLLPGTVTKSGRMEDISFVHDDPDGWSQRVQREYLKPGAIVPAVIYLHGCAGPLSAKTWATNMTGNGFAFFAPDSFKRPGRTSFCGSSVRMGSRVQLRTEELLYALNQVRQLPWVDRERIVLMGFSEGGQTVAAFDGDDFIAQIILGSDCRFNVGDIRDKPPPGAPRAPRNVPVLNIVGSNDSYGYGAGCQISRVVGGSRLIVVEDAGHHVQTAPQALAGIADFLQTCCGYEPADAIARSGTSTAASSIAVANGVTFEVLASSEHWLHSRVEVVAGQSYEISASGSWTANEKNCGWSGPDGGSGPCSIPLSYPQAVSGSYLALIGKIGEGPPFLIGNGINLTADGSGILYLRMNDATGGFGNNEGTVTVRITGDSSP